MAVTQYKGFGGVRLEADEHGRAEDPCVLLVHGAGQSRRIWDGIAASLVKAGRRVVAIDLRGHGGSEWPENGCYDFEAYVEDMRAVLAQMDSRPVIVAATLGAWISVVALGANAATLAAGLVTVDLPTHVNPDVTQAITSRLREDLAQIDNGKQRAPDWDERMLDQFDVGDMPEQLAQAAARIQIPALYVRGALSNLVSQQEAAGFVAGMPDAELVEVDHADLLVTPDRIDIFNGVLLEFLERKHPREAPQYRSGSDSRTFRDALGCFATGVTVVTSNAEDGAPIGLTANSFTSVSLEPPLLLVCVANNAGSAEILRTQKQFAVNVLQIGQQPTSNRFAGKGEDRFANTDWQAGENGAPIIHGSLASFECTQFSLHDAGDHFILVGEVTKATFDARRDPLLYFGGKYRSLHFS